MIKEIAEIVLNKKNGKSTSNIQNYMLRKLGETMIEFLYPLIQTIWKEESTRCEWNKGHITSIWKGKGDMEDLQNARPITTSTAIGTIFDTLLDNRIEQVVPLSRAQGTSTCDFAIYN